MRPAAAAGWRRGVDDRAGEMHGEGGKNPETVELGRPAYGPAAHDYPCCWWDVKRVEHLAAPVDAVRERCHFEAWEGYGAWRERRYERGETVFEVECLEYGHERETLEELLASR